MMPKVIFCPKCHKRIRIPLKGFENLEVKMGITIECGNVTMWGNKRTQCTGKVVIKSKSKETV